MTLAEIRSFPTTIECCAGKIHESCLRSYQTLEKVKELLAQQVPPAAITEIIIDLQSAPNVDKVVP